MARDRDDRRDDREDEDRPSRRSKDDRDDDRGSRAPRKDRGEVSCQGMLDNAPTSGSRGTYLKLPDKVKLFQPQKNRVYRLIFVPWTAGKYNKAFREGEKCTNLFLPVHKNIGPNGETFLCMTAWKGKPCACCEGFAVLRGDKKYQWEDIAGLKRKDREAFLVHDLDGERDNLMVWEESVHLFGDYLRQKIHRSSKYKSFASYDHAKGWIVSIEGREKKMGERGSCTEFNSIEFEPRDRDLDIEKVYDRADEICLENCVIEPSYPSVKKLFAMMFGGHKSDDTGDDDDDRGGRGRGRSDDDEDLSRNAVGDRSSRRARNDDEEEATERRPAARRSRDEEEVDDPRPASRRGREEAAGDDDRPTRRKPADENEDRGGRGREPAAVEEPNPEPDEDETDHNRAPRGRRGKRDEKEDKPAEKAEGNGEEDREPTPEPEEEPTPGRRQKRTRS